MSAEKRSVSTDALETLGTIITDNEKRDAIHLAVNPTQAKQKLYPGQDVGIGGTTDNPVGIVDPFLKSAVHAGDWFWLVVYPRQITSLRHVWSHPAFPDSDVITIAAPNENKSHSEEWLRTFCETHDCVSYGTLIDAAKGGFKNLNDEDYGVVMNGDSLTSYGSDAHCELPMEFWDHLEIVAGRKFPSRPTYFSCSC